MIDGEVEDIESKWTIFKTSVAEAVSHSCSLKDVGATTGEPIGGHQQ